MEPSWVDWLIIAVVAAGIFLAATWLMKCQFGYC